MQLADNLSSFLLYPDPTFLIPILENSDTGPLPEDAAYKSGGWPGVLIEAIYVLAVWRLVYLPGVRRRSQVVD